jgi:hypothetical protein
MAGRLALASEVAGGHTYRTILIRAWSANWYILVLYVLLRPLRPELDRQDQVEIIVTQSFSDVRVQVRVRGLL